MLTTMWSSGQPQQTSWGWGSHNAPNNQFNNQEVDPAHGWAAAAALWAQQRQLQEQNGMNHPPPPMVDRPPEPPGPPPLRPPLPVYDIPPPPLPHPPPNVQSIEVHDYMHGKAALNVNPPAEVIDYQHGKISEPPPPAAPTSDNFMRTTGDEAQPEYEVTSDNWHEAQHQPLFYDGGWNQDSWSGDQMNYYVAAAQHYQNEYNSSPLPNHNYDKSARNRRSTSVSSGNQKIGKDDNIRSIKGSNLSSSVSDGLDIAKKAKSLPLWLRQGLEKMEKEKKKQLERNKPAEKKPLTGIGDYEHSPKSLHEKDDSEPEEKSSKPNHSFRNADKSSDVESDDESDDGGEEEAEKKFQQMMMKVKTWMTEILLGVTNSELNDVCKEVYFEVKRSAKAKATQVRRSGGLEALRSVGMGVDGSITSESESEEEEIKKPLTKVEVIRNDKTEKDVMDEEKESPKMHEEMAHRKTSTSEDDKEIRSSKVINRKKSSESDSSIESTVEEDKSSKVKKEKKDILRASTSSSRSSLSKTNSTPVPIKSTRSRSPKSEKSRSSTKSKSKSKSDGAKSFKNENDRTSELRLKYYKKMAKDSRSEEQPTSSSSENEQENNDSSDSENDSESDKSDSSDSDDDTNHRSKYKKSGRKSRSDSSSHRNKKKKRRRKDSTSDDSDHGKRRKRKDSSSSSDRYSKRSPIRKKKSLVKKHKSRTKSKSRSPKSKRKR